jgi:regulation of enolase protein 1 (concanavalin A-like superfamily)
MVKGSVKYQDLFDQGFMIIRREEYERLITDIRIYEEALQIISVEPGILNIIAEKMRRLAQHALKKYH